MIAARATPSASRSGLARRLSATAAVPKVGTSSALLAPGTVVIHRAEDIVSIVLAHRGIRACSGLKPSANNVMESYGRVDGSLRVRYPSVSPYLNTIYHFFAFCYDR